MTAVGFRHGFTTSNQFKWNATSRSLLERKATRHFASSRYVWLSEDLRLQARIPKERVIPNLQLGTRKWTNLPWIHDLGETVRSGSDCIELTLSSKARSSGKSKTSEICTSNSLGLVGIKLESYNYPTNEELKKVEESRSSSGFCVKINAVRSRGSLRL